MSYTAPVTYDHWAHCVSSYELEILSGLTSSTHSSGAWPAQYLAIYAPVLLPTRRVVKKLGIANGSTASGNLDLGLYDAAGTRLVSTGSTAQSGTSTEQVIDVTDTAVGPGLYYLAACFDGTTGTVRRISMQAPVPAMAGLLTETLGSVVLPATASWAVSDTLAIFPVMFAFFGTVVA